MKTWLSFLLCLIMAFTLTFSFGENASEPVPLPEHQFYRKNGVVIETGIRAVQDFEIAHSLSEDMVGWIYGGVLQNGFPVMIGTEDNFYLNHTFQGKTKNARGCVCLKAGTDSHFTDQTIFLIADSRKNNPQFGFSELTKQASFEELPYFRLLTPNGDFQLDIFAVIVKSSLMDEELQAPTEASRYSEWLANLVKMSSIQCDEEALPQFGEQIVVFSNDTVRNRKIILASLRPVQYETDSSYSLSKWEMDHTEGISHTVDAGALGEKFLYLQKDPLWSQMRFESAMTPKYRVVSGGACGPFALANILGNILTPQELMALDRDCPTGFGALFCSCSVNLLYCNHSHLPYHLTSAEEYARYLPIILCNFATGNNPYGVQSRWPNGTGTNTIYVPYVCEALSLECVGVYNLLEGIEMVLQAGNRGGLLCCALGSSPFSAPGNTHYVSIIGVDEEGYVYVLDSMEKKKYKTKGGSVETLSPGLGRFHISNSSGMGLSPCFYIGKPGALEQMPEGN